MHSSLSCMFISVLWPFSVQVCTSNGHLYRVTYTRCPIGKIISPARNMWRIEINIHEKELCFKLVIYKDCTEMHCQQNIKKCRIGLDNWSSYTEQHWRVNLDTGPISVKTSAGTRCAYSGTKARHCGRWIIVGNVCVTCS